MDDIDRRLLTELARNARVTLAALAEVVDLSAPAVHDRVHKLEAQGLIRGYAALIDPESAGLGTAALVSLRIAGPLSASRELEAALAADPRVLELHEVAGEDCYVAKVRVASPAALAAFLTDLRELHPGLSSRSAVVLRSCFERPILGLPEGPGARPRGQ